MPACWLKQTAMLKMFPTAISISYPVEESFIHNVDSKIQIQCSRASVLDVHIWQERKGQVSEVKYIPNNYK